MKIKSISGFNFAGYSSIQVNLDEHATYFIGRNGSGKTKLGLELVWFVMQGIAEKAMNGTQPLVGERFRFIGDAAKTAMGELVLYDENRGHEIRVIRKLTKSGTELSFSAPVGMELDQQWLNNLFNIFLISPKENRIQGNYSVCLKCSLPISLLPFQNQSCGKGTSASLQ